MTGRMAFIDGLLLRFSGVLLSCKGDIKISDHSLRYHLIITLYIRGMFLSKYRFEIPPLQRCGWCSVLADCIRTYVGKRQPPLRQHLSVFKFVCKYLKCLRSLKIPPTVKYALQFVISVLKVRKQLKFTVTFVKCMEKT
jgi:hypothetical protein